MELESADYDDEYESDVLPDGTALLGGQYVIERYLSSGGFGITYFARDSLDRRVVIKECFPEAYCSRKRSRTVMARSHSHQGEFRSIVDMFMREAHSIAKLSHPHIVGVHQVFQDNDTAYMALDLIDGKDLLDIIDANDEQPAYVDVKAILLKVLDAIATVHDQDMLHRDISPDNILIDAWDNPVLIDFGAAREEASKKSRALSAVLVVKDGYSPHEFYIAGSKQFPCSDLYALAATFYHLITGEAPPHSQTRVAAIAADKPDPCVPLVGRIKGYPRPFLEAIDKAMRVFPQDRIATARDWILLIDESKRRAAALAHAQEDKEIEQTVMQLIQAELDEGDKGKPISSGRSTSRNAPNSAHGPAATRPQVVLAEQKVPEVLSRDAADDFDAEEAYFLDFDAELRKRIRERSDWIARARAKHTISRIDLYERDEEKPTPKPVLPRPPDFWHQQTLPWWILGGTICVLFICVVLLGTTDVFMPLLSWMFGGAGGAT
ncbi:MAG: serine/threonine-protein kinase [Pseudomonadota bacterium]